MPKLIIAIDGCSSSGKGTFAKRIASCLSLPHLDSGAAYRAVTLHGLRSGRIAWNGDIDIHGLQTDLLLGKVDISFCLDGKGGSLVFLGGENVSSEIRGMEVARNVSAVSALPFVRNFVDEQLHRLGGAGCVMDGRDIGTAVFPEADLKIFLTADPAIRAQRRVDQMRESGQEADFNEVLRNVQERDYYDSHRAFHPLLKAADAIELDNSNMTVDQQMEWLDGVLKEKFGFGLYEAEC